MRVNNINRLSFKGYKNILADEKKNEGYSYKYMALQLNNNGSNDLDEWYSLQSKNTFDEQYFTDVLTFSHLKTPDNEYLHIGNDELLFGNELLEISQNPNLRGSYEVKNALKAYTFLCKITKKLMEDSNIKRDKDIFSQAIEHMQIENNFGIRIPLDKFLEPPTPEKVKKIAGYFNKGLENNMEQFFKY